MPLLLLAIAAVAVAVYAVAKMPLPVPPAPVPPAPKPTPAAPRPTVASVSAAWPGYVVLDIAKYKTLYDPPPSEAPFAAVGAEPFVAMKADSAGVGTVPAFLAAQLAAKRHVWMGPSELDPTASKPERVLPLYVGTSPPAGFTEIFAS